MDFPSFFIWKNLYASLTLNLTAVFNGNEAIMNHYSSVIYIPTGTYFICIFSHHPGKSSRNLVWKLVLHWHISWVTMIHVIFLLVRKLQVVEAQNHEQKLTSDISLSTHITCLISVMNEQSWKLREPLQDI